MRTFTSLMIVALLSLCHYVDRLSPKLEESSSVGVKNENLKFIEYGENAIESFSADTVYYTYKNSNPTKIYDAVK